MLNREVVSGKNWKAEKANLCHRREDEANSRSQDLRSKGEEGKEGGKRELRGEEGGKKAETASRSRVSG